MSFYIDSFMPGTVDTPSIVTITLPDRRTEFKGLLGAPISVQLSNRFGNLIPGIEMLADIAQLAGAVNIPAWIGASAQGWRGTDPVKFSLEVYLINYKPHLGYEEKLKALTKLVTISPGNGAFGGTSHATAQVHGGYSPDVFASNKYQFVSVDNVLAAKEDGNLSSSPQGVYDRLVGTGENIVAQGLADYTGTIRVKVGTRFRLNNLLVASCNITPSVVEVYSPTAGEKPKPLYYRVSLGVLTCRAALSTDVEQMFG